VRRATVGSTLMHAANAGQNDCTRPVLEAEGCDAGRAVRAARPVAARRAAAAAAAYRTFQQLLGRGDSTRRARQVPLAAFVPAKIDTPMATGAGAGPACRQYTA
jgi:hypothetical protein